ncbi:MAG: hypothetical protein ACK56F_21175, partial [bacterium]
VQKYSIAVCPEFDFSSIAVEDKGKSVKAFIYFKFHTGLFDITTRLSLHYWQGFWHFAIIIKCFLYFRLNLKILLLVRDPRGTMQSRKHRVHTTLSSEKCTL